MACTSASVLGPIPAGAQDPSPVADFYMRPSRTTAPAGSPISFNVFVQSSTAREVLRIFISAEPAAGKITGVHINGINQNATCRVWTLPSASEKHVQCEWGPRTRNDVLLFTVEMTAGSESGVVSATINNVDVDRVTIRGHSPERLASPVAAEDALIAGGWT